MTFCGGGGGTAVSGLVLSYWLLWSQYKSPALAIPALGMTMSTVLSGENALANLNAFVISSHDVTSHLTYWALTRQYCVSQRLAGTDGPSPSTPLPELCRPRC